MARIRIERVPIAVFHLGLFGFDHLQLVYQNDETNSRTLQDDWYVMEGLRDAGPDGVILGVEGWDGTTTLAEANAASGDELVGRIGTPTARGSREVPVSDPFSAWQLMASYAEDIASQELPYIAFGFAASATPTINSSSVIASLLYYAGVDMQTVWPYGTRFSPGTTTLLGTSGDDEMKLEQSFTTLVAGKGDDLLEGRDGSSGIDKLYGGEGDDRFRWSTGTNIVHGGQPSLDYEADGTDTLDYSGVGEVLIMRNKYAIPHVKPTFYAIHEEGLDWLFSIERLEWTPDSDNIRLGKGVELIEENLTLKLGMEESGGKGDVLDFAAVEEGLLINASDDGALFVTGAASEADTGLWVEEADWLIGSEGDDIIYAGAGLHGIEGGRGADLIDVRDVTPGAGTSPQGYDLEIEAGEGDDVIVIGEGRTLLRGGDGDDTFILTTLGGVGRGDEIVFEGADSGDRLLVPYDLFNGSGGDYEGSVLFPVLGAHGRYENMAEDGWTLRFDWRLENDWFFGDDQTKGFIDFTGNILYEVADGDLLVHLYQGEPVRTEIILDDTGATRWEVLNRTLYETETILRITDYEVGDLGINFFELGEEESIDFGDGSTGLHYPGHDPGVYAMTNNGQFIAPLDSRPTAPARPDEEGEDSQPPAMTGGDADDVIAAAAPSRIDAGGGNDQVTGSSGADVLDGGTGDDALAGGAGRDTYRVDSAGDTVAEQAGGGIDTVVASVDFSLGAYIEHLTLTGTATLGQGNALANRIIGNGGANVLEGLAGDDTLYGGLGADTLQGGDGSDGYVYSLGDGDDTIADSGADSETDTLVLTGGVVPEDVTLHRLAASPDDLVLSLAQGGRIVLAGFMASPAAGIDAVEFDNGAVWSRGELEARAAAAPVLGNDPPQAVDDPYLVAIGPVVLIPAAALLANDRDFNGDGLSIVEVGTATAGSLTLEADGNLRLSVPAEFEGITSFSYTISDGRGGFSTARAEIAIAVNHAPVAAASVPDQVTAEDVALSFALPPALFSDPDGDGLTFAASLADGAALPPWLVFDAPGRLFTGTPPPDFHGAVDVRVTASDGAASTSVGFRLLVTPVNDAPQAQTEAGFVTGEGVPLVIAAATLLANATDVDGDGLALLSVADAVGGSVAIDAAGNVVFTPAAGATGAASFRYTIGDGQGGSSTATVELTIEPAAGGTFAGTAADDVLAGTAGADVIEGHGGDDQLAGLGGNDTFKVLGGETGFDTVDGGEGIDRIAGSEWNDVIGLAGLSNVELIDGGAGSDTIRLTSGNDTLDLAGVTVTGIELIDGGAGNDTMTGSAAADVMSGGEGDDFLSGGEGDDAFNVLGGLQGFDVVLGGAGFDRIQASPWNDVIGVAGVAGNLVGIEAIDGGGGSDTMRLTSGNDTLDLTGIVVTSVELIDAGAGNDTVTGSAASDIISGGAGDDVLEGGAGDDVFNILGGAEGFDVVRGGEGFDRIQASPWNDVIGLASLAANLAGIEAIEGGAGSDTIRLSGGNDTLDLAAIAVSGVELVDAAAGNDIVTGSASADVISGGAGDDVLEGGAGDDVFNILGGAEGFDVVRGGEGFDRIQASPWNDVIGLANVTGNLLGVEAIDGGAGTDTIRLTGGNDRLDLSGIAVTGIELVDAGAGNDVVTASAADDVLKGGLGNDTFVFAPGFGHDTIGDFQIGSTTQPLADTIDLSAFHYESFAELQSHLTQVGSDTVVSVDAASSLRLTGVTLSQLQADDFVL